MELRLQVGPWGDAAVGQVLPGERGAVASTGKPGLRPAHE